MSKTCQHVVTMRRGKGTYVCTNAAAVCSNRMIHIPATGDNYPYSLYYCKKHQKFALIVESPKIISITSVEVL